MTEEQGERIIKLLESIDSKLNNIEYNTDNIRNLSNEIWVLDDIKEILKNIE